MYIIQVILSIIQVSLSLLKRPKAANWKWPPVPRAAKSGQQNMTIIAFLSLP